MNDADRKAFDKWCKVPGGHLFYHMQAEAWQAACEWRDSQAGEPVKCIKCGDLTHHIGNVCYGCNNALAAAKGVKNDN